MEKTKERVLRKNGFKDIFPKTPLKLIISKKLYRIKRVKFFTALVLGLIFYLILLPLNSLAVMQSENYTIKQETISAGEGPEQSANYKLFESIGEVGEGAQRSTNYNVGAGQSFGIMANFPPAPSLVNDSSPSYQDKLHFTISPGNNPSDSLFAIAITDDNWATTKYIQNDNSAGNVLGSEDWQTYINWGGASGELVTGLKPQTTYKIKVEARQGDYTMTGWGPESSEANTGVQVSPPPIILGGGTLLLKIYDAQALEITDSSALISWKTDQLVTSKIIYGKTMELEIGTISDNSFVTEHNMKLTGLEANTEYYFQIKDQSQEGSAGWTGIFTFKTLRDTTPPLNISDFTAVSGFHQIQLSWKNPPDKDFKGVRIIRSTEYFPLSPEEGTLVYDGSGESYLDENLTSGIRYYYSAFAYDTSENFSSGAVATEVPLPIVGPIPPILIPPTEVEILKTADFHFQIAQKTINVLSDSSNVFHFLPGTILHISIETEKLPKVLKTIMVDIGDKSYLLQIDESKKIYQAGIILPLQEGLQPIYILVLNFKEGTVDKVKGNILVEPFGMIEEKGPISISKHQAEAKETEGSPVYLAKVTLYQYDENSKDWQIFQALKYSQRNPIYSNPQGQYGFLVPRGKYYALVEKENYETLKTKEFEVDKNFINQDIFLKQSEKPNLLARMGQIRWQRIILILALMILSAVYFFRRHRRLTIKQLINKNV